MTEIKIRKTVERDLDLIYKIWLQTGWNSKYQIDYKNFKKSWQSSYLTKCIENENSEIIAIGRAISDGTLYAMIYDIVVDKKHRKKGFGRLIVNSIIADLKTKNIKIIQLMSAIDQTDFYKKIGFTERPYSGPGMQLENT